MFLLFVCSLIAIIDYDYGYDDYDCDEDYDNDCDDDYDDDCDDDYDDDCDDYDDGDDDDCDDDYDDYDDCDDDNVDEVMMAVVMMILMTIMLMIVMMILIMMITMVWRRDAVPYPCLCCCAYARLEKLSDDLPKETDKLLTRFNPATVSPFFLPTV